VHSPPQHPTPGAPAARTTGTMSDLRPLLLGPRQPSSANACRFSVPADRYDGVNLYAP
jgi:hypothetical protein